jgi:hypothetical protein
MSNGIMTTPTSFVRLNQPLPTQSQSQFVPQTLWSNNTSQLSPRLQYSPTIKHGEITKKQNFEKIILSFLEPMTPGMQQQSSILPTKLVAQPVVRQTIAPQQTLKFTEVQITGFVAKCRTFLTTLLKLAEKQAPDKLPMVRSCIQELLDGSIDPETFTQRLHALYKSQPHTSLVPFFKVISYRMLGV